jgi:serine/threonine protein phosphatase PrpC
MTLKLVESAYRTDTGRQRHANEDSLYAEAPVFAVADGMGGAQAGEVASKIAADEFSSLDDEGSAPERSLRNVVRSANQKIHDLAKRDASRSGMGTTLTAAMIGDDEVSFAHVGDSRAYVYRAGELKRLTSDHSLVEELRRQGRLTEAQAEEHPQRSIITRALGPEPDVDVDTLTYPARPGDVYLLCSDGLTTMVPEARIERLLDRATDLDSALDRLVREANEGGGRDNITVVAFRLDDTDAVAKEPPTLIAPPTPEAAEREPAIAAAAPRRRRWPRRLAGAIVALLIIAGLGAAAVYGARQVYFLGVDEGGRIGLYRGLPYELPLGIELYDERYSSPVQADALPPEQQSIVTGHELRSRDDATSLVEEYEAQAEAVTGDEPGTGGGKEGGGDGGGGKGQSGSNAKRGGGSGGQKSDNR